MIAVLKEAEAGTPVPELCRTHGISNATIYKWQSKFGGMIASLMWPIKELKDENRRLKRLHVDAQLSADLLREAARTTIQHACVTFAISETCYRHQGKHSKKNARIAEREPVHVESHTRVAHVSRARAQSADQAAEAARAGRA